MWFLNHLRKHRSSFFTASVSPTPSITSILRRRKTRAYSTPVPLAFTSSAFTDVGFCSTPATPVFNRTSLGKGEMVDGNDDARSEYAWSVVCEEHDLPPSPADPPPLWRRFPATASGEAATAAYVENDDDVWRGYPDRLTRYGYNEDKDTLSHKHFSVDGHDGDDDNDISSPRRKFPWERDISMKMSGRKLLIAVDFTEECAYAFRWMVKHQLRDGDRVHVVHVMDKTQKGGEGEGRAAEVRKSRRSSLPLLFSMSRKEMKQRGMRLEKQMTERLSTFVKENWEVCGVNAHVILHTLSGKPKDALIHIIDDIFPDLVIAGYHREVNSRHYGAKPHAIGRVCRHLMQHSLVPVLVARDPTRCERLASSVTNYGGQAAWCDLSLEGEETSTSEEEEVVRKFAHRRYSGPVA